MLKFPAKDLIRFGRLREQDGEAANDVVLVPKDSSTLNRISRWYFELYRRSTGLTLRSVSNSMTEVDGQALQKGGEAPIRAASRVRVGGVMTVEFVANQPASLDATWTPGTSSASLPDRPTCRPYAAGPSPCGARWRFSTTRTSACARYRRCRGPS